MTIPYDAYGLCRFRCKMFLLYRLPTPVNLPSVRAPSVPSPPSAWWRHWWRPCRCARRAPSDTGRLPWGTSCTPSSHCQTHVQDDSRSQQVFNLPTITYYCFFTIFYFIILLYFLFYYFIILFFIFYYFTIFCSLRLFFRTLSTLPR